MKVVIIHGTFGNPQENRFPWLKEQLEQQGHEVWIPNLPTPDNQTPEHRCDELQKQVPFIFGKDTILVGHSLGATYLLHILDRERREPLRKAIFVSGFIHELGNNTFDKLNKPFLSDAFNRERISHNISQSIIFHGDNDPYVPISEAEYLSKQLGAKLIIVSNGGHLNSSAGFSSFPILLEELLK